MPRHVGVLAYRHLRLLAGLEVDEARDRAAGRAARLPAFRVSSLELPSNPSSTSTRLTWRCRLVLGGEPDAAEHLLAVPGRGQRGLARGGLGQQRGRRSSLGRLSVASAPSMATSVSASRWRTAWNDAIGRPNWARSNACWRASASIARDAADEPPAQRPARPRPAGSSLAGCPPGGSAARIDGGVPGPSGASHTTQAPPAYGSGACRSRGRPSRAAPRR